MRSWYFDTECAHEFRLHLKNITYPTMNIVLTQKLFHDIFAEVHYVLQVLKYFFRGLSREGHGGLSARELPECRLWYHHEPLSHTGPPGAWPRKPPVALDPEEGRPHRGDYHTQGSFRPQGPLGHLCILLRAPCDSEAVSLRTISVALPSSHQEHRGIPPVARAHLLRNLTLKIFPIQKLLDI